METNNNELTRKVKIVNSIREMLAIRRDIYARHQDHDVKLVPTMGALHAGHGSLINCANKQQHKSKQKIVIVSIFVNPLQFNNPQDLTNYPSTLESDVELCSSLGVDYIFAPPCSVMYPSTLSIEEQIRVEPVSKYANAFEGLSRPGHFTGMLTVVIKLFNIIQPDEAYFGEKDYQQMILVERLVQDLNMNIKIIRVPSMRDKDLLPLSSRNVRLNKEQRTIAAEVIHKLLSLTAERFKFLSIQSIIETTTNNQVQVESILNEVISHLESYYKVNYPKSKNKLELDYLGIRCAQHFSHIEISPQNHTFDCRDNCAKKNSDHSFKARILTAIVINDIRLLDNIEIVLNC